MEDALTLVRDALDQPWVRAMLVVLGSLLIAKIVDVVLCGMISRLTARTRTNIDDRLIQRLHRPIFLSVVLLGLRVAVSLVPIGDDPRRLVGRRSRHGSGSSPCV